MTVEEVFKFAVENFAPYMQNLANDIGKEKFIDMLKKASFEITEKSDKVLEVKFTECLWAKVFREANASDIGYAIHCYPIDAWARAFNPKIKGTLPKNLMEGQDECIVRYNWKG